MDRVLKLLKIAVQNREYLKTLKDIPDHPALTNYLKNNEHFRRAALKIASLKEAVAKNIDSGLLSGTEKVETKKDSYAKGFNFKKK